jgi:CRP-like cAMP-binding protein
MPVSRESGNRLLNALSPATLERLRPQLEACELGAGQEIHMPGERADYVYFPINGVISTVASMSDGASVEVGVVGSEGMFGVSVILGDDTPVLRAMVQIPGRGLRMKAHWLRKEMQKDAAMRALLLRYAMATLTAVAQSAACNRLHMLEQRCARWLLTAHDCVGKDEFRLTHEFLAMMLGVRRAGVTIAAQSLQGAGLIAYAHGTMSVHDRPGLEAVACECYQVVRNEFDRLMTL